LSSTCFIFFEYFFIGFKSFYSKHYNNLYCKRYCSKLYKVL